MKHLWPVTASRVTGLKDFRTQQPIRGWMIAIPLTAEQMLNDRKLALKKIQESAILAEKKGATIIGLGAMTASLSKGGLDLVDVVDAAITTGHAYTVHNVTSTMLSIIEKTCDDIENTVVAIVGASGSIGSNSARILSRHGFKKMLLIDVAKKNDNLTKLRNELITNNNSTTFKTSNTVHDIIEADFIITATSAPEALVRDIDLKPGAIIVDDAQPSDIDESAFKRKDVLVLEAGAVRTPGIKTNFYIDLQDEEDNFSCMAELLILAAKGETKSYGIGGTTVLEIDEMAILGKKMGFRVADYQNKNEKITTEKIQYIKSLRTR